MLYKNIRLPYFCPHLTVLCIGVAVVQELRELKSQRSKRTEALEVDASKLESKRSLLLRAVEEADKVHQWRKDSLGRLKEQVLTHHYQLIRSFNFLLSRSYQD